MNGLFGFLKTNIVIVVRIKKSLTCCQENIFHLITRIIKRTFCKRLNHETDWLWTDIAKTEINKDQFTKSWTVNNVGRLDVVVANFQTMKNIKRVFQFRKLFIDLVYTLAMFYPILNTHSFLGWKHDILMTDDHIKTKNLN